ncbi:MAG: hypothetical protein JJU05_02425 [Verrucomicrobia bacterium]|nr:hypothetical protein [Verrucomicrobiota bacterium]MCH8526914.1 hypothetical protein [Kiritimatiellia bacterium]
MSDSKQNDGVSVSEPDRLLVAVNRSVLAKTFWVSLAAHVAVLGLTSFGLYRDWAEMGLYSEAGFHTPSTMAQLRRDRVREREAEARAERETERRTEQAARALEAEERAARQSAQPSEAPGAPDTPVEPEIEPLEPRPFSLDDLPDLDI